MFRNKFNLFARFNADGNPGGSGGDGGSNDAEEAFQRRLDRNSQDGITLARQLWREVYDYRQELKAAKAEVATLQGKVPSDGALVLSGDDAKAFEAYKALGTADEVKQGLTQAQELQGKLDRLERDATLRTIAESAGYKPSVLARLDATAKAEGRELVYEIRDVDQDGQTVRVAYVKEADTEKTLSEFATTEWADFLPALALDAVPQGGQPPTGTRFPAQNPAPAARKQADLVDKHLQEKEEKRKAERNPLLPSAG